MPSTTFENVLNEARQLTPEDRSRLLAALGQPSSSISEAIQTARNIEAHTSTNAEKEAVSFWLAGLDALATDINSAWQGTGDAVDAVREQRREL